MELYDYIYKQIEYTVDKNLPLISNLSNAAAILNKIPNINWCGFYLVKDDYLYLGPFQGEPACTIIEKGKGVCGASFLNKETIVVDNVDEFDGHIRCSEKSKSEIVVPILVNNQVVSIIDIDSPMLSRFSQREKELLEKIAKLLSVFFKQKA